MPPVMPGKAFGSGRHDSTRLCVEMINAHLKEGDSFLDVGTGTGILMVVAAKKGAGRVAGFDRLPFAAFAARDNLLLNGVKPEQFAVFSAADIGAVNARFDVVAINILPEAIVGLLPGTTNVMRPGGMLLCSGMIRGNTHRVRNRMQRCGFNPVKRYHRGMWEGIAAIYSPPVDLLHRVEEPGRSFDNDIDQHRP